MPRSYLRYVSRGCTGVISANEGNIALVRTGEGDSEAVVVCTPALENVHIFDAATMAIVGFIPGGNELAPVTALQTSPAGDQLAVGYGDGCVSVYLTADWSGLMTRGLGHKLTSKVLCFGITADSTTVASGGSDTDIVVWDVSTQDAQYRLRGHKSAILGLAFLEETKRIVSVAGDGLVKVWDHDVRACVHSFIGASSQATSLCIDAMETRLVVGARDNILKVYNLQEKEGTEEEAFAPHGTLERQNHRPVAAMRYNPSHTLLAVQSADRVIEFFAVQSEKGVSSRLTRQKKRKRAKAREDTETDLPDPAGPDAADGAAVGQRTALSEYLRLDNVVLRADSKIRSFAFVPQKANEPRGAPDRLFVGYGDNQFEEFLLEFSDVKTNPVILSRGKRCDIIGHRGEIRSSAMSHSNRFIATCAVGSVKVWSIELEAEGEEGAIVDCTQTVLIPEPTTLTFLPGDQHLVVGTKEGTLHLVSLAQSEVIESFNAHEGEVASVVLKGDRRGVASGGKDKKVKLWALDLVTDESTGSKRVTLAESSVLEFTDAVTAIAFSEDNKFFSVALHDNTVKIYFADSCKFFLSLYGHKYPVTAVSFSSDSRLLATASIDKNVKLWGLDFGDCHKSIFAHDDYVTDVKFVGGTHYFWTTGKDGLVKCWDADHFTHVQTLKGHHGAVWSCELSGEGGVLISLGADRTLRSWVRTEELLFPEEEQEKEMQEAADRENAASLAFAALDKADAEVGVAGQRTALHLQASEDLVEALDLVTAELERKAEGGTHAEMKHPLLGALTPLEYLAKVVEGIKGHSIRYVLSGLPTDYCRRLLSFILDLLKRRTCRTEAASRVTLFLIRQLSTEIASDAALRSTVLILQKQLQAALMIEVNNHGFNNAGLAMLASHIQEQKLASAEFFDISQKKGHKKARN
ncbi:WD repeat-containing protein 3-like protein [Diplonema papillatum]|nr:WD repeat-containing protein 3-like protein [Diplonema papillatum]